MKIIQILLISCLLWLFSSCGLFNQEIKPDAVVIVNDTSAIELPYYKRKEDIQKTTFQVCKVKKPDTVKYVGSNYREVLWYKFANSRNRENRNALIHQMDGLDDFEKAELSWDENYIPEGLTLISLEACAHVETKLLFCYNHPFVETVEHAYSNHYPLTISPDMIWLMIAQGFANHVNENAEALRHHFVDFQGKKELKVQRDEFIKGSNDNDWMAVFEEFEHKIEANTGKGLLGLVASGFSTTGPIEKVAFQVCLMDAMQQYFDYSTSTMCGIPEVTLEGTVEDWKMIEKRAAALAKYDLDWWIDELMPVLKEFTKAVEGKADTLFWQGIYKEPDLLKRCDEGTLISGWILKFFPYMKRSDNRLYRFLGNDKMLRDLKDGKEKTLVAELKKFPSGISKAPFTWNYFGVDYKMEFNAGFVGCTQDEKTLSLRPEIGWAVIDLGQKSWAKGN